MNKARVVEMNRLKVSDGFVKNENEKISNWLNVSG